MELVQDLLLNWLQGTQMDSTLVEEKIMLEMILSGVELPLVILLKQFLD
jgi:hypothetical protein